MSIETLAIGCLVFLIIIVVVQAVILAKVSEIMDKLTRVGAELDIRTEHILDKGKDHYLDCTTRQEMILNDTHKIRKILKDGKKKNKDNGGDET